MPNCTSLEGIPKSTIDNLVDLKEKSGCGFNVTGGTETGHTSHGSGMAVVDVSESSCLGTALRGNYNSYNITKVCTTEQYSSVSYNCGSYREEKPHFHLVFSL